MLVHQRVSEDDRKANVKRISQELVETRKELGTSCPTFPHFSFVVADHFPIGRGVSIPLRTAFVLGIAQLVGPEYSSMG